VVCRTAIPAGRSRAACARKSSDDLRGCVHAADGVVERVGNVEIPDAIHGDRDEDIAGAVQADSLGKSDRRLRGGPSITLRILSSVSRHRGDDAGAPVDPEDTPSARVDEKNATGGVDAHECLREKR
jgi:hypothetical protein